MIRFLAGVVIGSLGATYLIAAFLPATREERPREPLVGPRDPGAFHRARVARQFEQDPAYARAYLDERFRLALAAEDGDESDDTWTSGPIS